MTKYTLIAEHTELYTGNTISKSTHEFEVDGLMDVVENVELFLKGAGFVFDGFLDIVPVEEDSPPEWTTEEWDTPQEDAELHEWTRVHRADAQSEGSEFHSKHYFDTERNK
jgi:hypothetical protein